ncbi:ATP-binding cassette domain-containing protein, partial [Campylobacter concisus]|uniref:ATP-binding cassette domain-containing protein n=1 Tax=Campylobacter concisus TaxID=199 RepID=UPI0021562F30
MYSQLAKPNAIKVRWEKEYSDHCLVCTDGCRGPHVLVMSKKGAKTDDSKKLLRLAGADCRLCGRCIDVCHQDALRFDNGFKRLIEGNFLIDIQDVTKIFGSQMILYSVSLNIKAGEKIAILWHNGAGKCALMRIILGESVPKRGRDAINGGTPLTDIHEAE